ncbi:ATP:cob(I)alamin adenosyltransferase [Streptococcus sanguinis]|uniref:ATP:cob(I)alamin adenosyltransferase n=1 Tax=Streptococcus sanguinis TaxID=1305 RepID=A0A7Y0VB53_STRSA|nr:ATP:cob(I)alamin adenosyltransferase [Streptococcus sanguinis]
MDWLYYYQAGKDDKLRDDELLQLQHYLFDCGSDLST